jgi:hypothetical protein
MQKKILTYFLFIISLLVFISIKRNLFSLVYWPLWIGGVIGVYLPGIDDLLHVFLFRPYELTSQRAKSMLASRRIKDLVLLLYDTNTERFAPIFHTAFFQVVFLVLTFLVVTSSGRLIGKGIVLGASVHLVIDQLNDLMEKGNLNSWFRETPLFSQITLDKEKALVYWGVMLLGLLVIAFIV